MTLEQAILQSTARVNVLAEVTVGALVRSWVKATAYLTTQTQDASESDEFITQAGDTLTTQAGDILVVTSGSFLITQDSDFLIAQGTNAYRTPRLYGQEVVDVKHNGVSLTPATDSQYVEDNPGTWFADADYVYANPFDGIGIYGTGNALQVFYAFYFSTYAKNFNNRHYDPRIKAAPSISMRIEKTFTGVGQVGGGTLSFLNADKFFDGFQEFQWNSGTVVLKLGIDTAPDSDMAYSDYRQVAAWAIEDWENDLEFKLKLVEQKSKLKKKIPITFYDRITYPAIGDSYDGAPIPLAYGKIFSVKPALIHVAQKKFKVAGHAIYSFDGVKVKNKDTDVWEIADFVSKDTMLAEFTLGAEFTDNEEVAVDFTGRMDTNGRPMLNAADIIKDIMAQCGETNINAASFATAAARLTIGINNDGDTVYLRSPSLYLDTARDALSIISDINQVVGSFLFNDANGQFYLGVFEPIAGEGLELFEDIDVVTFKDNSDILKIQDGNKTGIVSKLSVAYAERAQEEYFQRLLVERKAIQYANGQSAEIVDEKTVILTARADAQYWAERFLTMNGGPLRYFQIDVPWRGLVRMPGDQIRLVYVRRGIDMVVEVLEARLDYTGKKTTLILGNMRGLKDTPGFWVDDAAVLPTRFATEAGYSSGSLVWNVEWSAAIKTWARQNVGYWTTEEGFANSTDPDSYIASAWV